MKLKDALPEFCDELQSLLAAEGQSELLQQLPSLQITSRCGCRECGCATIRVAPVGPPRSADVAEAGTRQVESLQLDFSEGTVVLDTDDSGRIVLIEILDRPDLAERLRSLHVPFTTP